MIYYFRYWSVKENKCKNCPNQMYVFNENDDILYYPYKCYSTPVSDSLKINPSLYCSTFMNGSSTLTIQNSEELNIAKIFIKILFERKSYESFICQFDN